MKLFKIDKGIPIPTNRTNKGTTATLRRLSVGDSFFLPTNGTVNPYANVLACARRLKIKVTSRAVHEDDRRGLRVWRTQ